MNKKIYRNKIQKYILQEPGQKRLALSLRGEKACSKSPEKNRKRI